MIDIAKKILPDSTELICAGAEDLPTDKFGADFGANYFNPNSGFTFSEQVQNYLIDVLGATDPRNAPNYNSLPDDEPETSPEIKNRLPQPLFTE